MLLLIYVSSPKSSRSPAAFEEPMPAAVYLTLQTNAWVARHGGILGFSGRRVMALGLPLLPILAVSELRAILAHEFSHYYGGDTGLGLWINRARETLARSLQSLAAERGFLHFVSRQREYRADELACAVAGAQPLLSGLRKITLATFAWPSFWTTEAVPALQAGFGPPLADGFAAFCWLRRSLRPWRRWPRRTCNRRSRQLAPPIPPFDKRSFRRCQGHHVVGADCGSGTKRSPVSDSRWQAAGVDVHRVGGPGT
jgi:hypothetical protein